MKILLVGGGSGGSVSPLLAIASHIQKQHKGTEFLFVGSSKGPELTMVSKFKIPFFPIHSGKLRRYFSWSNFAAPFYIILGFFESLSLLRKTKPDCIIGTGSYVQVPVAYAGWLLKIPIILHQQDIMPSLANILCQFLATKITLTFEPSIAGFSSSFGFLYSKKITHKFVVTGNPFRNELLNSSKEDAIKNLNLDPKFPTLLILGGGTGSAFINNLVLSTLEDLTKYVQIIHVTGMTKMAFVKHNNYHAFEFITDLKDAYKAADVVISRAGLSTITELSNLKKLSIIIPMPNSHQEVNAVYLARHNSAIILNQSKLNKDILVNLIHKLLFEHNASEVLKNNIYNIMPHDATEKISELVLKIIK